MPKSVKKVESRGRTKDKSVRKSSGRSKSRSISRTPTRSSSRSNTKLKKGVKKGVKKGLKENVKNIVPKSNNKVIRVNPSPNSHVFNRISPCKMNIIRQAFMKKIRNMHEARKGQNVDRMARVRELLSRIRQSQTPQKIKVRRIIVVK
jgi:superfamily II RNA helicase